MRDIDEILFDIRKVIQDFLVDNGGLSNGYDTWIKGCIRKNEYASFQWKTPNDNITIKEVKCKGRDLEKQVRGICLDGGIFDGNVIQEVSVESIYEGDGCFKTIAEVIYRSKEMRIWG